MNLQIAVDHIKVIVIGDIMLDHYIQGDCNRISPEAPVPVVDVVSERYTLGGAGNVVENLHAFGCKVDVACVVGNDANAEIILKKLSDLGIPKIGIVIDSSRCTTIKTRVLATKHQLIRLDREVKTPIDATTENKILDIVKANVDKYQMVLLSDYNKGLLTQSLLAGIFDICKKINVKTIVDPKGTDFAKYKGVNIIKPNKKEAIAASGIQIVDLETLKQACIKIKAITECDDVIVTMSEEGIAYYSANEIKIIPTKAMDVVDVTGAGDTVLASLGLAIASGSTLHDACDFANHAAAIVVSKVGSATVTLDEINNKTSKQF